MINSKQLLAFLLLTFTVSYGISLPIAEGNRWEYSFRDSICYQIPGSEMGDSITTGTLIMQMGSIDTSKDSVFFTIDFFDTGRVIVHGTQNSTDTTFQYTYKNDLHSIYLLLNDTVYKKNTSSDLWVRDVDPKTSFYMERDTAWSIPVIIGGYSTYYLHCSEKEVEVQSQPVMLLTKENITSYSRASYYQSTALWLEKTGLINYEKEDSTSNVYPYVPGKHFEQYSLITFNNQPVTVGTKQSSPFRILKSSGIHPLNQKQVYLPGSSGI